MYDIMIYIAQTCKMEREKERVGGGMELKKQKTEKGPKTISFFRPYCYYLRRHSYGFLL